MHQGDASRAAAMEYLDALNSHDPDAIAATVTEDFVNRHASSRGTGLVGRSAYRERLPTFLAEFEALHYEPECVIAEGSDVAIPYRMRARWRGPDEARHEIDLRGVFHLRTRGGLVASRTDYWDSGDFLRQTGQA